VPQVSGDDSGKVDHGNAWASQFLQHIFKRLEELRDDRLSLTVGIVPTVDQDRPDPRPDLWSGFEDTSKRRNSAWNR
jgi:hypothetical protein